MNLHQLEYVLAVAEEKSISKAAKKLYISQPSLSQYIMRLEDDLGVKLFDRTTASLTLTFAGQKYIETAKKILNLNNQLQRELSDIACSKKGHLSIGVPTQTGRHILPLILPKFHRAFPEIELSIEENVTSKLEEMLIEGNIDIAILSLPIEKKQITYERISSERIFLVAPKNHPISDLKLLKNKRINLNCLKNENFILPKRGQRMRLIVDDIFEKAKFKPKILFEMENLDTAHRIAAAGMGFTFVPENVIWLFSSDKYSNYFWVNGKKFVFTISYRRNEYIPKSTQEFINMAKETLTLSRINKLSNNRAYRKIYTSDDDISCL